MARDNPSNPYTRDRNHTSKDIQMPISKARVVDARCDDCNGLHTVRIRVYGDGTSYLAPVLTPMIGSVWIPSKGDDVAVLFTQSDKPWVIGSWYALDRVEDGDVDLPSYEVGDIRLGNHSGSHVTVHEDGRISIRTAEQQRVDIDSQTASIEKTTDQIISGDDTFEIIEYNSEKYDDVDLYNIDTFTLKADGSYNITASCLFPNAGQNNTYNIGLFVNDELVKRKARQSVVKEELSLDISYNGKLSDGDTVTARVRQDSGSDKTLLGDPRTNDFTVRRDGI